MQARRPNTPRFGVRNKYFTLFSTSSGSDVDILEDNEAEMIFATAVKDFLPQLTDRESILNVLDSIKESIQHKDEQREPRIFCGGGRVSRSCCLILKST